MLGNEGVGKSSLIARYVKDEFKGDYMSTVGVDFLIKEVSLNDDTKAKMVIWDIGGQSQWQQKLKFYLKGADGAVVVCDITRPGSGKDTETWIEELKKHAGKIPYILVANKSDLEHKIPETDLIEYADGRSYFIASAKTGEIVEQFFQEIAFQIFEYKKRCELDEGRGLNIFLSYATVDADLFQIAEVSRRLTRLKKVQSAMYWQKDMEDDIYEWMEDKLKKCDVYILFCSKSIEKSEAVNLEWHAALKKKKIIIPVFDDPEYIPVLLSSKLGVQFKEGDLDKVIAEIYKLILKKLKM